MEAIFVCWQARRTIAVNQRGFPIRVIGVTSLLLRFGKGVQSFAVLLQVLELSNAKMLKSEVGLGVHGHVSPKLHGPRDVLLV
jgi:hypothetical protein